MNIKLTEWFDGDRVDVQHLVPIDGHVALCGRGTNLMRNFMAHEPQASCSACLAARHRLVTDQTDGDCKCWPNGAVRCQHHVLP